MEYYVYDYQLEFFLDISWHEFERNKELQNERADEKAKLDKGRGILEERIREIAGELATSHSDSGTSAENHPEERRRDGDTNYREWSVERLAGQVAENEQRSNRFLKWGKNAVRKLEAYVNRFRNSGSERRLTLNELEWEARQLAECMEEIRCNYAHYDYDLKTFLLPWLKKRPIFDPEVDTVYRHELNLLDEFRYTINTADPIILILAQSMRPKIRAEQEAKTFKYVLEYEFHHTNGLSPEESKKEFLLALDRTDRTFKDLDVSIDSLCESLGYEKPDPKPIMRRGRHR